MACHLCDQFPDREVILVSKDINLRIKGRTLGVRVEDYTTDQALEDADLLYTGTYTLAPDFWETHAKDMESWQEAGRTFYRITGPAVQNVETATAIQRVVAITAIKRVVAT